MFNIPLNLLKIISKLEAGNFEVFVVGGAVRDVLLKKQPDDWDLTTNAKPEEVLKIFPDAKYKNEFGTVLIPEKYLNKKADSSEGGFFEITTYRKEGKYTDKRRPDKVIFADNLEDDLKRRDFTINALAMGIRDVDKLLKTSKNKLVEVKKEQIEIVDKFQGREDLKNKIIKTVGNPVDRIKEDALRMMRAIRLASQLNFKIEEESFTIIQKKADNLKHISKERIQEEFKKIILSKFPTKGVKLLIETGLMKWVIPEISETIDVRQNYHHYHGPYNTVDKHLLASLDKCPSRKFEVRMAAFLHDIGKPGTKQGSGYKASFHNHEYLGAKMVKGIMERLKFSREEIDKTVLLVENHMFYYNVDEVGEAGVRKVIRKVGLENIKDLIDVRIADRLGSGVPKAIPYKLRHFQFMVDKVSQDPISVKQLKINGNDLIQKLKIKPSPKIGAILDVLLMEVIETPAENTVENLLKRAKILIKDDLNSLRQKAKEKIKIENKKREEKIKSKHWVK
jgi:poly(A) polymerase/tRNA nucleotidyltransferase (CCA-adding enzyme)